MCNDLAKAWEALDGKKLRRHVPDIAGALRAVQAILPKLEVKMIEFLAEWMVTFLMPASHVLEVRAPHLSFMMLHFATIFVDYCWSAGLHLGEDCHALFSHRVRSHSSRALCARVSICGGAFRAAVVPNALRKGLSGGMGDGRC